MKNHLGLQVGSTRVKAGGVGGEPGGGKGKREKSGEGEKKKRGVARRKGNPRGKKGFSAGRCLEKAGEKKKRGGKKV